MGIKEAEITTWSQIWYTVCEIRNKNSHQFVLNKDLIFHSLLINTYLFFFFLKLSTIYNRRKVNKKWHFPFSWLIKFYWKIFLLFLLIWLSFSFEINFFSNKIHLHVFCLFFFCKFSNHIWFSTNSYKIIENKILRTNLIWILQNSR